MYRRQSLQRVVEMRTLRSRLQRLEAGRLGAAAAEHEPMFYRVSFSSHLRPDNEPRGVPQRVALEGATEVRRDGQGRITGYVDARGHRMIVIPL